MLNLFQFARRLAQTSVLIHPGRGPSYWSKRLKFWARGMIFQAENREWFSYLERPEMAALARQHPCLYHKLQRPYLNCRLTQRQRRLYLEQHYSFMLSRFSRLMLHRICGEPGLFLAALPPVDQENYELRLAFSGLQKEGDLILTLRNQANGHTLFTLAFSIIHDDPLGGEIFIGALQGNKEVNERERVVTITRALHGLRPKALLLFALQQLAQQWKIAGLRATSDDAHIYRHWQKRRDLASSYDEWWLESGGQLADDGNFDLPPRFVPRDIAKIKANKRGLYRHRYHMLEDLARQMAQSLTDCREIETFSPAPPAPRSAAPLHQLV